MTELNSLAHFDIKYNYETSSYEFTTDDGVSYTITFIDYSEVMEVDFPVYSFAIERTPETKRCKNGNNAVRNTVIMILSKFFERNENVMIVIYDSSDKRQMCRKRLFDKWFEEFNDGSLYKLDGHFTIDGIENFAMALCNNNHPNLQDVEDKFRKLLDCNFYN